MEKSDHNILQLTEALRNNPTLLMEASEVAKDATANMGLLLKAPDVPDAFLAAPVTLFPSLIPSHALNDVLQLQQDINLLMHHVSHDREFLTKTLAGVAAVDPFIRNLMDIYNQIDIDAQWELEFIRSDYLMHCDDKSLSFRDALDSATYKQVEVNMICIAFAGLSAKMNTIHNRVLNFLDSDTIERPEAGDSLPLFGGAVSLAHSVYQKNHHPVLDRPQILLTVVNKAERNTMDQRMIEFESGLICLRRTFEEIGQRATLQDGRLIIEDKEVAVVYYRDGYAPPHYAGEEDWKTRLMMEKSVAIKCPSVAHQLSGFKKVQQELGKPEVLERFIPDESVRTRMLEACVGQWDLSSPNAAEAIADALKNPVKYILKPNREGGGNNFYDDVMVKMLKEIPGTEAAQEYILMSRIEPPLQENFLVRPNAPPVLVPTISEIGVFGVLVAKHDDILLNLSAKDILVRSKASNVNEGGVSTGYASLSSAAVIHV